MIDTGFLVVDSANTNALPLKTAAPK